MTYTHKAVTKAIEGDYDAHWDDTVEMFFSSERKNKNGNLVTLTEERIVLDPAFWQCLYQARGYVTGEPFYMHWRVRSQWFHAWHRLIDHLADGGDIESFFAELLG